jgi:stage II sporulation protein R
MKKILIVASFVILLIMLKEISLSKTIIPDEAIRLRVLANSNSEYDQIIKNKVKDELQGSMYSLLENTDNIAEARDIIKTNLNSLDLSVETVLAKEDNTIDYEIDFGKHYFPDKVYKGVTYDEGYYESLLVKLGEGKGDNWWCVLFPPLCLLEAEESTEVEYKFFVQELIDKYF